MKRMTKRLFAGLGAAVLAVLMSSGARADFGTFNVQIYSDAALTSLLYTIDDDGAGDSNLNPNLIGTSAAADLAALNAAVVATGIQFDSLDATSNAGSPPLDDVAVMTVVGNALVGSGFTSGELYILVSAIDFSFPAGPTYGVTSSASHTFTSVEAGTSPSFVSYFNDSNTLNATETATGLLVFAPPVGTSSEGLTAPELVTAGSAPYGLSSVTRIRLVGATASDLFTGTTTVRAIPEPGSLALVALGGSGLLFGYLRRRKAQA